MMKIQCSISLIPTKNGRQRSMMFHKGTLTSVSVSLKLQKYFLFADHRTCKAYTQ